MISFIGFIASFLIGVKCSTVNNHVLRKTQNISAPVMKNGIRYPNNPDRKPPSKGPTKLPATPAVVIADITQPDLLCGVSPAIKAVALLM